MTNAMYELFFERSTIIFYFWSPKIKWGLAPVAPKDTNIIINENKHGTMYWYVTLSAKVAEAIKFLYLSCEIHTS
jgi:hypothetical protein